MVLVHNKRSQPIMTHKYRKSLNKQSCDEAKNGIKKD